jgi:dephospho-CoA kinase
MLRLGLTGGIACGKSTVSAMLQQRGIPVIDADRAAREVVAPGTEGLAAVVERFGTGILQPDGSLDRAALRAVVTRDPSARRDLEAITHPRIGAHVEAWLADQEAAGATVAAVDAALMIETGSVDRYDRLLVVATTPELQLARIQARDGHDLATARRWLDAQLPIAEKVAAAERHPHGAVVMNTGSITELATAVDGALRELGLTPSPG